jgi:antitoxin component YwqK of YwqJK toxin-antitoxin module
MILKYLLLFSLLLASLSASCQPVESLNKTDNNGSKQGHWIKKYPNGHVQYDGYFKDNQPYGAFKRYYENDTLHSVMIFSKDGKEAFASIYHPNGFIASKGKYINQLKEGKWQFFSSKKNGYLICEEEYKSNTRNGTSLKFYPDSSLAESISYINDIPDGVWMQYFQNKILCLKTTYVNGKLNGSFATYFDNGKPEFIGQYKNDARNGIWKVYNTDGNLKYSIEYVSGVAVNPEKFRKETDYLDALEKNKGKISDPEKTGSLWQ